MKPQSAPARPNVPQRSFARPNHHQKAYAATDADDDGLDEASNRPIDLIDAGHLDEAEQAAHDLLQRYPQVHDGLERLAMVYAARGDHIRAAEYHRKAADFVLAHGDPEDLAMHTYPVKRAAASDSADLAEWSGGQAT